VTRPYAEVIGDPISHSKSPLIHNFWLERLGIDAEYRACHVRPDELEDYFAQRRRDAEWRGCNVTVPHKEAVLGHADRIDADAQAVGALNTLVNQDGTLFGYNTDTIGVREALASVPDMPLPANHVATLIEVIGAGGAARAAGAALRGGEITFFNRDASKAGKLADEFSHGAALGFACGLEGLPQEPFRFDSRYPNLKENRGEDQRYSYVIINSSTMGMAGKPEVPINLDCYPEDTIVFDMVYAPLETGLLKAARERGMRTADGLWMLIGQAAAAFERFFGRVPPREHDAELRRLLTS
jgi:shikimate dehydrogenase